MQSEHTTLLLPAVFQTEGASPGCPPGLGPGPRSCAQCLTDRSSCPLARGCALTQAELASRAQNAQAPGGSGRLWPPSVPGVCTTHLATDLPVLSARRSGASTSYLGQTAGTLFLGNTRGFLGLQCHHPTRATTAWLPAVGFASANSCLGTWLLSHTCPPTAGTLADPRLAGKCYCRGCRK